VRKCNGNKRFCAMLRRFLSGTFWHFLALFSGVSSNCTLMDLKFGVPGCRARRTLSRSHEKVLIEAFEQLNVHDAAAWRSGYTVWVAPNDSLGQVLVFQGHHLISVN
jgi:hypothetical protein